MIERRPKLNLWRWKWKFYWMVWRLDPAADKREFIRKLGFPGGSAVNNSPANNAGDTCSIPGLGRSLEKEMASHSSILAWRTSGTEKTGRLQYTGSQKSWTRLSGKKITSSGSYKNPELGQPNKGSSEYKQKWTVLKENLITSWPQILTMLCQK